MNINQLKDFVAVAKYGSINKAAKNLYISQPHLSNTIKDLEDTVGFKLFNRTNKGVSLTNSGKYFLKHSKSILRDLYALESFSPSKSISSDIFRVSITKFIQIMDSFNEICRSNESLSDFTYILNEGTTREVIEDVANGYTDIGIVHYDIKETENIHSFLENSGLTWSPLANFPPEIYLSKNHELVTHNKEISLYHLKDYGFIRYLGQYEDFLYNISENGYHIDFNNSKKIIYLDSRETMINLISTSNYYTIGIKQVESQKRSYNILSVPVKNCKNRIVFEIIKRDSTKLNQKSQDFISMVSEKFDNLSKKES